MTNFKILLSDIDECSYNYCLTPSICVNTPGSFHCDLTTAQTSIFPIPGSPVIEGCTGYTDLMNDPAVISDDDIAIQYQETRVIANDVFEDVEIREIPSVARETFTAEFPEEPEFWVESLMIKVGENVNLNVIFVTCTDQIDESTGNVTRNFGMTEYIKASTNFHYVDLSAVKDGKSMACACKIVLKTERLNIVADSSKFKVETYIDGCSLFQGEIT